MAFISSHIYLRGQTEAGCVSKDRKNPKKPNSGIPPYTINYDVKSLNSVKCDWKSWYQTLCFIKIEIPRLNFLFRSRFDVLFWNQNKTFWRQFQTCLRWSKLIRVKEIFNPLKSRPSERFHRPEMSQIKAEISLRTNVKLIFHNNVGLQWY